jgi:hypothetical protein
MGHEDDFAAFGKDIEKGAEGGIDTVRVVDDSVLYDIVVNTNQDAGLAVSFVKANLLYLVAIVVLSLVMAEAISTLIKTWKE